MRIPQTIEDVRANVAACEPGVTFDFGQPCDCLVSRPFNYENDHDLLEFYPIERSLHTPYGDAITLPAVVCELAIQWDNAAPGFPRASMNRDEALAFIDAYVKEHGDD